MISLNRPDIKAAATPALLERGCVHVIDFEAIKDQAGSGWDKIRDGVHAKLESILRQRLSPVDFFTALDDTSYLVTIPSSDVEDVEVTCLSVTYDLYKNYLGQFDLKKLNFLRASQSTRDGDTLVLDPIPMDRFDYLVERAGLIENGRPSRTAARPHAGPAVAGQPSAATAEQRSEEFTPQFAPMWDARKEAITSYLCAPRKRGGLAESLSQTHLQPRERSKVELSCISQGLATFSRHLDRGQRSLMLFRVSFETLGSPSGRTEFTKTFREMPSALRQYILFELADVPAGAPQSRLGELVMCVRPFSKAVLAQVAVGSRNHAAYQGIGLQGIGISLRRAKLAPREIDVELAKLSASGKRMGLFTFLNGVHSVNILRSAREAGVQFMTGSAIAAYLPEPGPMRRHTWDDALQHATRASKAA